MNINELNETLSIVDFLAKEGVHPVKKYGAELAYISPIREPESVPSFMVNIKKNRWYDHGLGIGGKLFDLAARFYPALGISQLLDHLEHNFSFRQQNLMVQNRETGGQEPIYNAANEERKIQILTTGQIRSLPLIHYLEKRCIPLELAAAYCSEVWYGLYGKKYYALGFKNDAGGYELRNPYFKGSSSPKAVTFMDNNSNQAAVFEGFFNFLSYVLLYGNGQQPQANYLVLNSLSFFKRSLPLMEKHGTVNLYLDRDAAGMKCTQQALQISSRFKDESHLYENYKDLNQFLISNPQKEEKVPKMDQAKEISERKTSPREVLPPIRKSRGI